MALHNADWKDWAMAGVDGGTMYIMTPAGDRTSVRPLLDIVKRGADILVVAVSGGEDFYNSTINLLDIYLFEEGNMVSPSHQIEIARFTTEMADIEYLINIGNSIIKDAESSDDLYLVFRQAHRKYDMMSWEYRNSGR